MKIETLLGAGIAAIIFFIGNITTLFMENPDLTFGAIRQSAWVSIVGGAVIAFLKDYQALSVRRSLESKVTNSGNAHSHWMIMPLLAMILFIGGCGIQRPQVDSLGDAIVVTAADIETAATETQRLCGNANPGGPCADNAPISTDTKERVRSGLMRAQVYVVAADRALEADDAVEAGDQLLRAERLLLTIQEIIEGAK